MWRVIIINTQYLIHRIKKLQTYKFSENDPIILINRDEVILEILKYSNEEHLNVQSSSSKYNLIIGD